MSARDSWCTPRWLAIALGKFDLDPCSNMFSWVDSPRFLTPDVGDNGLPPDTEPGAYLWQPPDQLDPTLHRVSQMDRVFINPPYSRGQVLRWVRHWASSNFTFLLRWDPSTRWYTELMCCTSLVWFPHRRIDFEPPPGITASSNPYPHALYFKFRPPPDVFTKLANLGRFWYPGEGGNG